MAIANYVLLQRVQLAAEAASITFNNIPQSGYTDLMLKFSGRFNGASNYTDNRLYFNNSTTGYSERLLYGTGSAIGSATNSLGYLTWGGGVVNGNSSTANTFSNHEIYIPNYAGSNFKSVSTDSVTENNATAVFTILNAGLWSNTAAINSIKIQPDSGSYMPYTTASLYGLAAVGTTPALYPKATGGDSVVNDGTNWIHTFYSSGTFTPVGVTSLTCDYLVVAGGGSGGQYNRGGGGGGGAGGYRTSIGYSPVSIDAAGYPVIVGAGGTGTGPGNVSSFNGIASAGGGGYDGGAGGSGSGGYGYGTIPGGAGNVPSVTPSQGNNGGTADQGYDVAGAGGGGAGSAGDGTAVQGQNVGGNGGAGVNNSITGSSIEYCHGGGGGAKSTSNSGGNGGSSGGNGGGAGNSGIGQNAPINRGGGGGGKVNGGSQGGNGGSGVVVIRYPIA